MGIPKCWFPFTSQNQFHKHYSSQEFPQLTTSEKHFKTGFCFSSSWFFFRQIDNTSYSQHALRLKKMYMQLEHHQNTNQHSHSLFTAELGINTRPIRVCADLCARLLALMDLRQPWLRALAILRNPGSTEFLNTRLLLLYKLLIVIGCLRVLGCLIAYV